MNIQIKLAVYKFLSGYIRFKSFMVAECCKALGNQPCENEFQRLSLPQASQRWQGQTPEFSITSPLLVWLI